MVLHVEAADGTVACAEFEAAHVHGQGESLNDFLEGKVFTKFEDFLFLSGVETVEWTAFFHAISYVMKRSQRSGREANGNRNGGPEGLGDSDENTGSAGAIVRIDSPAADKAACFDCD